MPLTARDVMETRVITVSPDDPLLAVQRLFVDSEINGAPVVDESGRVLGVISTSDLLRAVTDEHDSARSQPAYFREIIEFSGPDWTNAPEDFQDRLHELTAGEFMTDGVVWVEAAATIPEVARAVRENRVHRVLVVEDGVLRGIISTFDLVELLEKSV
jgi:CBS domain-containing protein